MSIVRRLKQSVNGLNANERAAAAVEFALVLPIMLAVYIGSVEASSLIVVDRKIQSVASSVGDLVARADETLSTADLSDFFRAAAGIMTPYSTTDVLQVVTAIRVSNTGQTSVLWSSQFVNGTYSSTSTHTVGSAYPLPTEMTDIARGETVIAAEASYSYSPMFSIMINQDVPLYRSNFYLPRFGGTITLTN